MKIIITATAPTSYQLNSLKAFGMGYNENGNGSFSAEKEFESNEAAKEYLKSRAEQYNSEDPSGSDLRLQKMYDNINQGLLKLDAVTAYIEEIEA